MALGKKYARKYLDNANKYLNFTSLLLIKYIALN